MIRFAAWGIIFALSLTIFPVWGGDHRVIVPEGMDLGLPFSPGVATGNILFVSGTLGNQPGSKEIPGGIREQTRQALENIRTVLREAGMDLEDIVSVNVYLLDARHYQLMNEIYSEYFRSLPPVRTTIEGDMVIQGALVEISAIAVNRQIPRKIVVPSGWTAPQRPYSWGIMVENTLFISGMVGRNVNSGTLVTDSFDAQAEQAFKNVGAVLKAVGMDYSHVVSSRVYLSDARDFQSMNRLFRNFFNGLPPVRATVKARLANPEMKIEVQCLAIKDEPVSLVGDQSSSPFSPALRVDDWLLMSGMVGRGPSGYARGEIREQTHQTFRNLKDSLVRAGMSFEDVVDVQVFLSDVRFYSEMNEVYQQWMPEAPPARATVGTPLMSPDALVEIMMTARSDRQ